MKNKIQAAYLYADGHAILVYEQVMRIGWVRKEIEYVELYEKWTKAPLQFTGRLVFHRYHAGAFMKLAKMSHVISCEEPSLERGSDKTKQMNLLYGDLSFQMDDGSCVSIPTFSDGTDYGSGQHSICSNGYTYQPKCVETFDNTANSSEWCGHPITKIHREKATVPASELESVTA